MSQPVPTFPTNVQSQNPYTGIDRGLFLLHNNPPYKLGRIHSARVVGTGPQAALSVVQYKVMLYTTQPVTQADYAAGTIATAPDGTEWFDTLARGSVVSPIMAEYWATANYLNWYVTEKGAKLTDLETKMVSDQAAVMLKTMGAWCGLDAIELTATFDALAGQAMTRTSFNLSVDYTTKDGVKVHTDISNLPEGVFDPVRVALNVIKQAEASNGSV